MAEERTDRAGDTPAPKTTLTLDPENRLPVARYQYVNVRFTTADQDTDIRHDLNPINPEQVRYKICMKTAGAVIYQDMSPTRKPWQRTHIWLRASKPVAARILLFVEPETEDTFFEQLPEQDECFPFSVINVPDQESVDADGPCGEVTYVAGTGMTITTDAASNRITWATVCCDDDGAPAGDECALVCTTTGMQAAPSAATGVSVTPAGSAWTNSAWAEIEDNTPEGWILMGITYLAPDSSKSTGNYFELDIGTGASGSESVVATMCGLMGDNAATSADTCNYFALPIPADVIPAGARVSARLRQVDTSVDPWTVAINYTPKPLADSDTFPVAALGPTCWPIGAAPITITPNTTAWANSAWATLATATGSEWFLGGLQVFAPSSCEWEIDVGIGLAGSEAVVTTLRGQTQYSFREGAGYHQLFKPILDAIPAGVRVAVRQRKSGTSATGTTVKAIFNRERIRELTTAQPMATWPSATDGIEVTAEGTDINTFGAWVEFTAATTTAVAIVGICPERGTGSYRAQIGTGPIGSETVIIDQQWGQGISTAGGWQKNIVLPIASYVDAGTRISMRTAVTASGTTARNMAIQYVAEPDFTQYTDDTWGVLDEVTLNPGTAWVSTSWTTIIDPIPTDMRLMSFVPELTGGDEYEFDLGVGSAGSEEVITTIRLASGASTSGSGVRFEHLPIPHCVESGQRLAARLRSGPNDHTGHLTLMYLTNNSDVVGPCGLEGPPAGSAGGNASNFPITPTTTIDNEIARWDGTTGGALQGSGITIVDGASGTLAGTNSGDVTLAGTPDYLTISGQAITRGLIDLATDVTGDLPYANLTQAGAASRLLGRGSAAGAGDWQDISLGTGLSMSGTTLTATSAAGGARTFGITIDGGGSAITAGTKGYVRVPFAGTITKATVLLDQSGSIVIDVWKDSYANYPPVDADSITAAAPPTVSSATKSEDATLTGWTTSFSAGDIFGFNVDSATTTTRAHLFLDATPS